MGIRYIAEVTCRDCKMVRLMPAHRVKHLKTTRCFACSRSCRGKRRPVLTRWLKQGKRYQAIADHYGISRQRVGQIALKNGLRRR